LPAHGARCTADDVGITRHVQRGTVSARVTPGAAERHTGSRMSTTSAGVDLYWLPLGAGGRFVRLNGKVYEAVAELGPDAASRRPPAGGRAPRPRDLGRNQRPGDRVLPRPGHRGLAHGRLACAQAAWRLHSTRLSGTRCTSPPDLCPWKLADEMPGICGFGEVEGAVG
jgi:hypothetical protein